MNVIRKVTVLPRIPEPIARLRELAYNLWWSWEPDAQQLFAEMDPELWETSTHNPVKFLQRVHQTALEKAVANQEWMGRYHATLQKFDAYMDPDAPTWFKAHYPKHFQAPAAGVRNEAGDGGAGNGQVIAYFSAEFGLHEALPIYSGGLGVLSGDHCKSASDLGLPFIGVGFLYPQGYFTQRIDAHGMQQAEYEKIDFSEVPATPAADAQGNPILVSVDLPGRTVYAKVWEIKVGRISIFLMDTDVPRNAPPDRELSARLYGGDREMRISQEVVLGIGGVRAVRALGYDPAIWHMNEGHSAFLGLERLRELIQNRGLHLEEAIEAVRANTLFTTHTPVPAGNDAFDFNLVEKFFWQYYTQLGIDRDRFMSFARQDLPWGPQFSMTVLALKLSAWANGVSKLHGSVSRAMWNFLWPGTPESEVPIGHITNGVHTKTWLQPELRHLYERYFDADWGNEFDIAEKWAVARIPDEELWQVHLERKQKMVQFARGRLRRQAIRHGEGPKLVSSLANALRPETLTLGFARRFATYKRAMLIFHDTERLLRLLHDPVRPIQIVFAGKAHPADEPGKALIQRIHNLSRQPEFFGRIVFLEDYDMNMARHLVSGVDVWLNNPRRPLEASGTSGQKAAANGVPNFSALDGWWEEGYDGNNGWAIGESRLYKDEATQDEADALSLYAILEDEIIPMFYERDAADIPHRWVERMKSAIATNAPVYSMDRQVKDYVNQYYMPAAASGLAVAANGYAGARSLSAWKAMLRPRWKEIRVEATTDGPAQVSVGEPLHVHARAWLSGLTPEEVAVEAVYREAVDGTEAGTFHTQRLSAVGNDNGAVVYEGAIQVADSGRVELGVRIRPHHPQMVHPAETGLITWA